MPSLQHITSDRPLKPEVFPFFDKPTNTFSYIVNDPSSNACAIIDSVMNIDYPSGTISYQGADDIIQYIQQHQLSVKWILETHVHADHLSAAAYLKNKLGGKTAIGSQIKNIQQLFGDIFNAENSFKRDGSQFDLLLNEGDKLTIGNMTARHCTPLVIHPLA